MVLVNLGEEAKAFEIRGQLGKPNGFGDVYFGWSDFGDYFEDAGIYQKRSGANGQCVVKMKHYFCQNPQYGFQQVWRGVFADGVIAWKSLSSEEKLFWKQKKYPRNMFGFHRFMRQYLKEHVVSLNYADSYSSSSAFNDDSIGTNEWTGLSNIGAIDNNYASVSLSDGQISQFLVANDFGFNIPSEATIVGVRVSFWVLCSGVGVPTSNYIQYNALRIVKNGVISSYNLNTDSQWYNFKNEQSFGSSRVLWGESFTPADINSSEFGVAISVKEFSTANITAYIDAIRIRVYYTLVS